MQINDTISISALLFQDNGTAINYQDGRFILDEDEVKLLSLVTMSDVEVSYPAAKFIAGLNEIETEGEGTFRKSHFNKRLKDVDRYRSTFSNS
ncbi:MAG: hypothetical protein PHP57_12500 [Sideroxydans sp.]|nr:hypothetical protein [Sideroxydans sp.]